MPGAFLFGGHHLMLKNCPICHKDFKVKPSHFFKRTTCSKACMKEYYRTFQVGMNNPHWKGGEVVLRCHSCGNNYSTFLCRAGISKYCSYKCLANSQRTKKVLKKKFERKTRQCKTCFTPILKGRIYCPVCSPRNNKAVVTHCSICNKEILRYKNSMGKILFCKGCVGAAYSGRNNPNWRGGIKPLTAILRDSDKMAQWKQGVFKRDNYLCVFCNTPGELHAHHIIPFSKILNTYSADNGALDLDGLFEYPLLWTINNGISLCPPCHRKIPNKQRV
jgi:hypothetical protein